MSMELNDNKPHVGDLGLAPGAEPSPPLVAQGLLTD